LCITVILQTDIQINSNDYILPYFAMVNTEFIQKNTKKVQKLCKKLNFNKTKQVKQITPTLTDRHQVVTDHKACALVFLIQQSMMHVHGNQLANVSCNSTNNVFS